MMSLSAVLAEIEASAEKIKGLEAALTAEKENGKTLVQQYRAQSADALKDPWHRRNKRPQTAKPPSYPNERRSLWHSAFGQRR
jgi:hypothetical protein